MNQLAAGHRLHRVGQHFDDLVHVVTVQHQHGHHQEQGVLQYETGQPDSGVHPHGLEDDAGAHSVYVVEAQDRLGVPRGEVVEPGLVGEQVRDRGSTST
nr:hypothetical protein [Janibacter sp. YB324]